jgi:hypothetical protein
MLTTNKLILALLLLLASITIGCAPSPTGSESKPKAISTRWDNKLVRRAGDTPEDGKIYVVRDGKRHWITHSSWIGAHASEFPAGVQTVAASELDVIREGDSITTER